MKHCDRCKKEMDTEKDTCPVCGGEAVETLNDEDAATIAATTTLLM